MKFFINTNLNNKKQLVFQPTTNKNKYLVAIVGSTGTKLSSNQHHQYIKQFISVILKKGLKKKNTIMVADIFNMFFKFIKNYSVLANTGLNNLIEICNYNFNINRNLFLINFIFKDIFNLLNPAFNFKLVTQNKKKLKKSKKKYKSQINYVFPEKRLKLIYSWITLYSNYFLDKSLKTRLFKSIFYTYIERRHSFLYLKKIETYIKYIDSKKRKETK